MFNQEIDVAKIMRKIKSEIEPSKGFKEGGLFQDNEINNILKEYQRIDDYIINVQSINKGYLLPGAQLPDYERFGPFIGKLFRLISKFVRKTIFFVIKDQELVNRNVDACIKALGESQRQLVRSYEYINTINQRIKELERVQSVHVEQLSSILEQKAKQEELSLSYVDFENKYRGTREQIKDRLQFYIDKFVQKEMDSLNEGMVIDIGCGRGEWLDMMKGAGIEAMGIDLNKDMVQYCRKEGLHVIESDAVSYLKTLHSNSCKLITSFQVIEHISVEELDAVLEEIYRVLMPDGMVILETPNAKNLEVGAYNFYLDPTHKTPIHHLFLQYMLESKGFFNIETAFWKEQEIEQWWDSLLTEENAVQNSPILRTIIETVKDNFYISPDYAIIGIKK